MTTDAMTVPTKWARSPTSDARFPFVSSKEKLKSGEMAVVQCSHQCYIMMMDDENLAHFIVGHKFHYYGGYYKMLPAKIPAPSDGTWNVVIHMSGSSSPFSYSVTFNKH